MRKYWTSSAAVAMIVGIVAWRQPHVATSIGGVCAPASDRYATRLLEQIRAIVSDPRFAARRADYKLPVLDPQLVQPVRSDSICNLASHPINRELRDPDSASVRLYMLSVGNLYWAEDSARRGGEWTHVFVLDSTLTKILVHTSR